MAAYEVADDLLLRGFSEHGAVNMALNMVAISAPARTMFPGAPEPFIDLSTGINPNPYPIPPLSADLFARLPEPAALAKLAAAAATAYGAPSAAHVVAAPGTQLLLPVIAGLVEPGRAAVLTPTYAEHARAAALAGHSVTEVRDIGALGDAQLAILTNPNNPDGRLTAATSWLRWPRHCGRAAVCLWSTRPSWMSSRSGASLADEVSLGNIVVLRSFGKFFGLAGLRLGFALAAPPLAQRISSRLGPWAVSGPALAIGAQALADRAWIDTTRSRLADAANRLDAILRRAGLDIVGGTTLFRLAHSRAAKALFEHLGRAGIFVRRFPDHPAWLRFGLPAAERDWQRLQSAMAAFGDNS